MKPSEIIHNHRRAVLIGGAAFLLVLVACVFVLTNRRANYFVRLAGKRPLGKAGVIGTDLDAAKHRLLAEKGSGLKLPLPDARIVVAKSKRTLDLYSGDRLIKTYPICLGGDPQGHKHRKGNGKTPEGQYFICTRRVQKDAALFIGMNYPNAKDAYQGLEEGHINKKQLADLCQAEDGHQVPPWNTGMGGAIGIHAGFEAGQMTAGCIGVSQHDAEEIHVATQYWTPVEIRP